MEPLDQVIEQLASLIEQTCQVYVTERRKTSWKKNIKGLLTQKISTERMLTLIKWMSKNYYRKTRLPKVHNAHDFQLKFTELEQIMLEETGGSAKSKLHSVRGLSSIRSAMKECHSKLDNTVATKLVEWINTQRKRANEREGRIADLIQHDLLVSPVEFARIYAEWIDNQVSGWSGWSGNYSGFYPRRGKLWGKWWGMQLTESGIKRKDWDMWDTQE